MDRLGHGTAVAAAIKEKAPDAEIYAVKVFDRALSASVTRWCARSSGRRAWGINWST